MRNIKDATLYREEILEHYRHPQNYGEIKDFSHKASVHNSFCGDSLTIFLKTNSKGFIESLSFQADACAIATASASIFTEWLKGKALKKMHALGDKDILKTFGVPVGVARHHCVTLPLLALKSVIRDYKV